MNLAHPISQRWKILLPFLLVLIALSAKASGSLELKGTVKDASTGKPIEAARIVAETEKMSATTGETGTFSLINIQATTVLQVTAFGYVSREVPVRGRTTLDIKLYPAGFAALQPSRGTLAITQLTKPENTTAVSTDEIIGRHLSGQIRTINRSGATGMGNALFIRGINSLNMNAQPLLVVDGVIRDNLYDVQSIHAGFFSNPMANIEVNDIESVQLLKEGTSLYGSRGANGVILINTKRGSSQVTTIDLNLSTGMSMEPRTIPVLGSDDYRIYITEILGTAGLTNEEVMQLPYLNDNPARSTYKRYHNQTNWDDYIYRTGLQNNYAISVNGGDDKALYYFALGYTNHMGVVTGNDFQRYNMRLNADIKLADNINTSINIGFSRIDRNLIDDGALAATSPTWMSRIKAPFLSPYNYTFSGELTTEFAFADIFDIANPPAYINHSINTVKQNGFNVGVKPVWQITPEISISEHFDYYLNKTNEDYYRPYLYSAPVFIQGIGDSYNARMSQVMRSNLIFSDTRISYKRKFGTQHMLNAFAGMRVIFNNYESDYVEGHNSRSNSSINLRGSFRNLVTDGINEESKTISNYLHANYDYDGRYFANATLSLDASSRFGNETVGGLKLFGNSWGVFPSVNAAWLISSEQFMKDIELINLLKIRAGYGITGNDNIPLYQSRAHFGAVKLQGVASGLVLSNLANPAIQWESTGRVSAGIDLAMLEERFQVSVDVYGSTTNQLLILKDLPAVVGIGKYWTNEGSLSNRGLEASLTGRIISTPDFQWEAGLMLGHYRNTLLNLPAGSFTTKVFGGEVLSQEGQSAGVFYGHKTEGVFATEAAAQSANLKMKNSRGELVPFGAGDMKFADVHADGIIDDKDKAIIGNPNPDWYGSFRSTMIYGGFSLNALFSFSVGGDLYNYPRHQLESQADYSNQTPAVLSRWITEGNITQMPKVVFGDPMGNARFSDRWIEDGSYLKLRVLTLAYNIPLKSAFAEGLKLWISGENIWTATSYLGVDPEFSANNTVLFQGVDAGLLPQSPTFTLGLKVNL